MYKRCVSVTKKDTLLSSSVKRKNGYSLKIRSYTVSQHASVYGKIFFSPSYEKLTKCLSFITSFLKTLYQRILPLQSYLSLENSTGRKAVCIDSRNSKHVLSEWNQIFHVAKNHLHNTIRYTKLYKR